MNCYGTLTALKAQYLTEISGAGSDSILLDLLEAASRRIDIIAGRHFYVVSAARILDVWHSPLLFPAPHPDLLSVSAIGVDNDEDELFDDETWSESDYVLYSGNGAIDGFPKLWLHVAPGGDYSLPRGMRVMQITGQWGYGDGRRADPVDSVGTLGAAITTTTATTATMTAGHTVLAGQTIRVGSEQMFVSAVSTNTLTVERGVNGTTAAEHLINAAVVAYAYPAPVVRACLWLAKEEYRDMSRDGGYESERLGDYSYKRMASAESEARTRNLLAGYCTA